jgi:hypothetical protein
MVPIYIHIYVCSFGLGRDGSEKNRPGSLDLQGIPMFGAVHTAQTLSTYNFL